MPVHAIQKRYVVDTTHYEDPSRNAIGWCSRTHAFFRGCSEESTGCKNCYAPYEAVRQNRMRGPDSAYSLLVVGNMEHAKWSGIVKPTPLANWIAPFTTRARWLVFANSMSDWMHPKISDEAVLLLLRVIARARQHQFQMLTKRAERLANIMSRLVRTENDLVLTSSPVASEQRAHIPNLWAGVSVENQRYADLRLPCLKEVRAGVRFVSFEPLLGPIDLSQHVGSFDWAIVGGESGQDFRPMDLQWARGVRDQVVGMALPLFFKQTSGVDPNHLPKDLDGTHWRELPARPLLLLLSDAERAEAKRWLTREYVRVFGASGQAAMEYSP